MTFLLSELFELAPYKPISQELRRYIQQLDPSKVKNAVNELEKANPSIPELKMQGLQRIRGGTDRAVFVLNEDYVLKVTRHHGVHQNRQEAEMSSCLSTHSEFFARVVDWDKENYLWLVMESLGKTAAKDTGLGLDEHGVSIEFIRWLANKMGDEAFEIALEAVEEYSALGTTDVMDIVRLMFSSAHQRSVLGLSPWFKRYYSAFKSCGVEAYDLHADNWAKRKNGDWAIVDYGT
jgi:hypothetical protein